MPFLKRRNSGVAMKIVTSANLAHQPLCSACNNRLRYSAGRITGGCLPRTGLSKYWLKRHLSNISRLLSER